MLTSKPFAWIALTSLLSPQLAFSAGILLKNASSIELVDAVRAETACLRGFCEPNSELRIDFGASNPSTGLPGAQPVPASAPRPDRLEYDKTLMRVNEAWEFTQGSPSVVVAVIDTGVQLDHPDLSENLAVNGAEQAGRPGVDDDGNGFVDDVMGWDFVHGRPNAWDDHGHGTHVAGIVAAGRNGFGTTGVAPRARVLPIKAFDSTGRGDVLTMIQAIRYAVKSGARVINASSGGYEYSLLLQQAIEEAQAQGVIFVASAGNGENGTGYNLDQTPRYPASIPGVIAVAANDRFDFLTSSSNFGKNTVLLSAAGDRILSTWRKTTWETMTGTSMAAPQVSGALALALALKPALSPERARRLLCDSSKKVLLGGISCGRLDVGAMISLLMAPAPPEAP